MGIHIYVSNEKIQEAWKTILIALKDESISVEKELEIIQSVIDEHIVRQISY